MGLIKKFHTSQFCFKSFLDIEFVTQKNISFLRKNREYQFITILEAITKVVDRHDSVFYFATKENFLEEKIEFVTIKIADNENINDIISSFIAKI